MCFEAYLILYENKKDREFLAHNIIFENHVSEMSVMVSSSSSYVNDTVWKRAQMFYNKALGVKIIWIAAHIRHK